MTEPMRYIREQYLVKLRLDKHRISLALRAAAIPWDTMAVAGGGVPVCAVAATCVAVETPRGDLSLTHNRCNQDQLVAADVPTVPH